ncbi:MAG: OmpA family protein [Gammaproteobacteria bacterium]|nr:OmpA family protein [Gammaproteobacteria bacterium]
MRYLPLCLLLLCPLAGPAALAADQVRESLFVGAETARTSAQAARAALLAPESFDAGETALARARASFERGRALERIRRDLDTAEQAFARAARRAAPAETFLAGALAAREAALASSADRLYASAWEAAERRLNDAAVALEQDNQTRARTQADEAEQAYRDVELQAIEGRLLSRARAQIAEAQAARVDRHAPQTLERARGLLLRAETMLREDRYAADEAGDLAERAAATARHARFLADSVQATRARGGSVEQALLDVEAPLRAAAREADIDGAQTARPSELGEALVERLRSRERQLQEAQAALEFANQRLLAMDEELRELDGQLGGVARERSALMMELEAQAQVRGQFARLEGLFTRDEAQVLREGERVIIRLTGLVFPTNSSTIPRESRALLAKLAEAANIFPQARFTIEGHTDSRGSAQLNLGLSQDRADAVLRHLVTEEGIADFRLRAVGLGSSRPIASNDTDDGRARNRRIDVTFSAATPP